MSYLSTLKTFSILLSVLLLQACTTLVANEKMHSSVKAPASTVRITVTETAIRGRLSAYLSAGVDFHLELTPSLHPKLTPPKAV